MRQFFVLVALLFVACGPHEDHRNYYQKTNTYRIEGDFHEPIATIIFERNGRLAGSGSGFLVKNKKLGIFATARHVIDLSVTYKVFFLGHVYKAERILDE